MPTPEYAATPRDTRAVRVLNLRDVRLEDFVYVTAFLMVASAALSVGMGVALTHGLVSVAVGVTLVAGVGITSATDWPRRQQMGWGDLWSGCWAYWWGDGIVLVATAAIEAAAFRRMPPVSVTYLAKWWVILFVAGVVFHQIDHRILHKGDPHEKKYLPQIIHDVDTIPALGMLAPLGWLVAEYYGWSSPWALMVVAGGACWVVLNVADVAKRRSIAIVAMLAWGSFFAFQLIQL